jgi:hypothetical protein
MGIGFSLLLYHPDRDTMSEPVKKGIKTQDIRTQNSLPSLMLQVVCSFVIMIIMNRACLWHQGEEERTTSVTDYRPIYVLLLILVVVSYQPYTGFCT